MRSKLVRALCPWRALTLLAAATFAVFLLLPGGSVTGATATDGEAAIVRVEEDWQLVLNEPDVDTNAPQFHTAMSPYEHMDQEYAQALWNYRELPEFEPGGLQLELWHGEDDLVQRGVGDQSLGRDAETITWTQRLEAGDGAVRFQVLNGRSQSWGRFGGAAMAVAAASGVPSLNAYSPSVSKDNSAITFGAHRVNLLVITEVRRYSAAGLVSVDRTRRVVYEAAADE